MSADVCTSNIYKEVDIIHDTTQSGLDTRETIQNLATVNRYIYIL